MSTFKDKAAREKLIRSRTNLLVSNGFFGCLAMHLRLVECTDLLGKQIPTMAVDGKSLFYNPAFVHKCSERELEGVTAHEVMHCAFQHFGRRGNRDGMIWNIAGDHVINLDLLDSGFTLPKDRLADAKYKKMTTEQVYDDLMKNVKTIKVKMGGGGKDGEPMDPGGCGGVIDAPGDNSEQAETGQEWETQVRMAVETARLNHAGHIPGSLQKLVNQLKQPKVSWREKTRRFIDYSMIKEVSWSRLSRRSVPMGVLMPGYKSDRMHHLVFITDTSGSISHELANEMVSEIAGALDEGTADMISVVYADTQVQHVDHFYHGDIVTAGKYSGGGTDFADSFKWIKENAPDASCVIYLTDLEVNNFGEEPPCPVLWAVYCQDHLFDRLAERTPFGQSIHISNTYA